VEIELTDIEPKYAALRVDEPGRRGRLVASLAREGQQNPVTVVSVDDRFVLIDGYLRVAALRELARDVVDAVVLQLTESDALILDLTRAAGARARTALEEGWVLAELRRQGRSVRDLAVQLQRSPSWVSRRLSLVQVLPERVQAAIKSGRVPAQAAAKYLVPLSRDNSAQCERLVVNLGREPVTVRQVGTLYDGWRWGSPEVREHIVDHPWLYLKALRETPVVREARTGDPDPKLLTNLERIGGLASAVRHDLRRGHLALVTETSVRQLILGTWSTIWLVVADIETMLAANGGSDAEPGEEDGDSGVGQGGTLAARDCQGPSRVPDDGEEGHRGGQSGGAAA
jgi:ParB family transcriptional regulator, chromosome partitioning protein